MIGNYQIINSDPHDISSRIKEVDLNYFIARNYKTNKFELHASNRRGGSLCLVLPFEVLDERTINYARRTRVENATKLFREMEASNKRLEQGKAMAMANRAIATAKI